MRGLLKRKLAVFSAVSGIAAGITIFGACPAAFAGEDGPQTKPSAVHVKGSDGNGIELRAATIQLQLDGNTGDPSKAIRAEGPQGQPVTIRILGDDAAPAGKEGQDGGEILRRLRERRAAELAEGKTFTGSVTLQAAVAHPDNAAQTRLSDLVGELAKRAVTIAAPKVEKVTFLGIGASPAPEILIHQLHLPADFGLAVDEVVPESPADKAGLKEFDLIQKLDDQLLVDNRQLTVLVRSHKPGETVSLTVIREGKPLTLKAKLGEHEEIAGGEGEHAFEYRLRIPPGGEFPGPAQGMPMNPGAPRPGEPGLWIRQAQPLPPGANANVLGGWRLEEPKANPRPAPLAKPGAAAEPKEGAADDEAKRLEEELQNLKKTADELRAQVKAQQKQEAQEQKEKEQKDGGEKP